MWPAMHINDASELKEDQSGKRNACSKRKGIVVDATGLKGWGQGAQKSIEYEFP